MRSSLHYEVVPRLARDSVEVPWQAVCQEEEETPPAMAGFSCVTILLVIYQR